MKSPMGLRWFFLDSWMSQNSIFKPCAQDSMVTTTWTCIHSKNQTLDLGVINYLFQCTNKISIWFVKTPWSDAIFHIYGKWPKQLEQLDVDISSWYNATFFTVYSCENAKRNNYFTWPEDKMLITSKVSQHQWSP